MGDEDKFLYEGDIVLLHNWGRNQTQIIGVATVIYDKDFHCWDFDMIAGEYIEGNYDKWRQKPKIIGNIFNGLLDHKYKKYVVNTDDCINSHNWDILIEEHLLKANVKALENMIIKEEEKIAVIRKETEDSLNDQKQNITEIRAEIVRLEQKKFITSKKIDNSQQGR